MRPDATRVSVLLRWLSLGAVALALIVFFEIDTLLGGIQGAGLRSFGTSTFTAPGLFWDTTELSAALRLWFGGEHAALAGRLIEVHSYTDLLFIAGYTFLLRQVIARIGPGTEQSPGAETPWIYRLAAVDVVETLITLFFLPGVPLQVLRSVTLLKWALASIVIIRLVVAWLGARGRQVGRQIAESRRGAQLLASATTPVVILAVIFIALVAFPGEGALAQLPDVLRYQFTEAPWWVAVLSTAALTLLIASVAIAGLAATEPVAATPLGRWTPVWVVGGPSLVLFVAAWVVNGRVSLGPLAPSAIVALIALLGRPGAGPRMAEVTGSEIQTDGSRGSRIGHIAGVVALGGGLGLVRAAAGPLLVDPSVHGLDDWLLALLVLVAIGLATWWLGTGNQIRRSRLAVVGMTLGILVTGVVVTDGLLWVGALGVATATVGGYLTWLAVTFVADLSPGKLPGLGRHLLIVSVSGVCLLAFLVLVVSPEWGQGVGTTGALANGIGALAVLAGSLVWLSRRFRPWLPGEALGLGLRPPWGTLLIVAWLVASPLTDSGYHDARVAEGVEPFYRYTALSQPDSTSAALQAWVDTQEGCAVPGEDPETVVYPMLLLAAPGGGVRAAYWTGSVLDRLTPGGSPCADRRVFLLSGVSGGGVGIANWLAARTVGVESRELVAGMSADRALAASAVGLFRDLAQPLLGFGDVWSDRAQLLEDGWIRTARTAATCPFSRVLESGECSVQADELLGWDELGITGDWSPVVVLNGSSVADACRVLSSNVAGLPASPGLDCLDTGEASGPLTGSTDPRANLLVPGTVVSGRGCPAPNGDLALITSALLGARFPIVSPSGAVHDCHVRRIQEEADVSRSEAFSSRTFVVDGGYYENSGLLSLLGVWNEVTPAIQAHNSTAVEEGEPLIEPWIVVASNYYTSSVEVIPPGRPPEVLLPITTYLSLRTVFSQAAFEQLSITLIDDFAANPCGPGHDGETPCFEARSDVVVIAPAQGPTVAAPLGWVLSKSTRDDLDDKLDRAAAEPAYADLARALRIDVTSS